ncbi:CHASE2 domain-containing protein [Afifella sp. IM 167]|uniref:CHASE2 domain-containing protein n=1 Tax=Afifella sp. IM 167 TaxID=2033586 RepID=UPI001CCFCEC7|nr:adenylate/guanylate cyclase domain-containing protein [Afifella sp. IM 167]MBZ8134964.1 adenylate/guanylate cyclase domain-containing protein [Afifella sp. IM 167]
MARRGARTRLPVWAALVAALAAIGWTFLIGAPHLAGERSLLDRLEAPLADLRLTLIGPRPAPEEIVIVAIDDRTVTAEGGYPLKRGRIAEILRALQAAGARAVAIDILFLDPSDGADDRSLAEALSGLPAVIAAAARFGPGEARAGAVPQSTEELWPLAGLQQAAATGLVNISTDPSGTPRHLPMVFLTSKGPAASFTLRAASLYSGFDAALAAGRVSLGERTIRLDLGAHLPIRFYGPAGTIRTASAADILSGRQSPAELKGRLAVLGVTATAVGDTFGTPFDPVTPGVEVLATGIGNLLSGDSLVRDMTVRRIDLAAAAALAAGSVLAVSLLPPSAGIPLALLATFGWLAGITFLFGNGIWLSAALPIAAVVPPVGAVMLARQFHERHQARMLGRAQRELRRLQSPVLAERIERDPSFLREPVEREVGILFLDLSGFTRLSEQLGPGRTRDFLKDFHALVERETVAHDGIVLSFMGDGAMIVFGVLDRRADDGARAFAATFALLDGVRAWIRQTEGASRDVDVRLGAHFGPVILSRLGSETHEHITTTGDSVNLASRLMEVAKEAGAAIVVSAELLAAADAEQAAAHRPDETREVAIRGRVRPVTVGLYRRPRPPGDT